MEEEEEKYLKIREELMSERWTEEKHYGLKELSTKLAKKIVVSMDEGEIYETVNLRQFQQDYIADYLEYIFEIDEESFWKQVKTTIDKDVGLLWSCNMFHFEKICSEKISDELLETIVDFALNFDDNDLLDNQGISCVLNHRIKEHNDGEKILECVRNSAQADAKEKWSKVETMMEENHLYSFIV